MRTSKSKIAYLIANIEKLELINSLMCCKNQKPETNNITAIEQVKNILNSHQLFKKIGTETIKITEHYNGDGSYLNIYIFSSSPENKYWTTREINLACPRDFIYELANK